MKKLLIALVVLVYSVPASLFVVIFKIIEKEAQDSTPALLIPLVLMVVVCVFAAANIAGAVVSALRSKSLPFKTVMVVKLCLIPFYIVNFTCWALASMVFHIAIVIWPIIPFMAAYTYFTMLGTSAHVISKLFILWRNKEVTAKQFCVHCILQIIFTADVFDCVYLTIKQKKREILASGE